MITTDARLSAVPDLDVLLAQHAAAAAALAAADAEAFWAEGPRIDGRIGTLLSLVLGGLASSGVVGGVGGELAHQRHAFVALGLLVASAVVTVTGLLLIVRLILPRLTQVTARSGRLARVSVLPDAAAAREHYRAAAQDCLAYQAAAAWRHAVTIARRLRRFRTAGRVLVVGVVLATAGFLALSWGW
ncbi:MAG TPA: hypothetical protein VF892_01610 [Pseudonocardiaceae bacterium]